jgi:hypothetical protein
LLSACPGFFDLRVFPLGSAWKIGVLEILGLDSESGLIMGDLVRKDAQDSALRTVSTLSYNLPYRPRVFDSKLTGLRLKVGRGDGNLLIRIQSALLFWARMRTELGRPSNPLVKAPAKSKTERGIRVTDKTGSSRSKRSL